MSFVSVEFLLFLLITWAAFALLPPRFRAPMLLVASYIFYAFWSLPFISIILLTTTIDYVASKFIESSKDEAKRKWALGAAIVLNLIILGVFKYTNFFLSTIHPAVVKLGAEAHVPSTLDIILPLGISFYTFEAISYLVDVYRGSPAAPSWIKYNFYIMYFPHLISGPIVRFKELFSQFDVALTLPPKKRVVQGIELILLGYLFKTMFADGAALICDPVFANPKAASVLDTYLGAFAFSLRVYFDFMGYTHIARGVSLLFNIELPLNFNHPFCATNISNFWERWHISLSRWIRDYLFVPFGGMRAGPIRILFIFISVMTLAGAWHGAGWTYVIWGAYHGFLLAFYHTYRRILTSYARKRPKLKQFVDKSMIYRGVSLVLTQSAVIFGLVIFGAPNIKTALVMARQLARVDVLFSTIASSVTQGQLAAVATLVMLFATLTAGPLLVNLYKNYFRPLPLFVKTQAAMCVVLLSWICSSAGYKPFIYFQF